MDGVPVPHVKMMTGAGAPHDRVTVNIIATLHAQLRGSGCRPTTDDIALRTGIATLRRPDVTVECTDLVRDTHERRSLRLVVEVLSLSTSSIDRFRKLDEYRRHPTPRCILLVEPRFPSAVLYRRRDDAWAAEIYETISDVIDLPENGARLALADIYEDVEFEPTRRPD
ncbi:Uma2 family endonuclease [Methylobacterium radiodurans]|uniref:Uma2 family endonuclease n=1 Tax=Methylobacterium radiodurans TaxID=2202828 RepID=UPI001FE595A9|nr:Uma2 family endonuclease [Methylobacterium radiodurans]